MKFELRRFSKRFPAVECAVFVVHEAAHNLPYVEYPVGEDPPSHRSLMLRGTAAAIILPDGRFWVGVCLCSSKDQFVKATGRAKAMGRAAEKMLANDCSHGCVTIIEAVDDKPIEPRAGDIGALKACLQVEINEAKKRAVAM